jgi:amylosucrase
MLASGDVRLASHALQQLDPIPASTAWITYARCHDDIGWAIDDGDAAAVGSDGFAHRSFLADFYSGEFPGSWARGLVFQDNPATGDRRISGSLASLAGLEAGDPAAVRRILLLHAVMLGFGGLPVLWMGDELGLLNDPAWAEDEHRREDNRWMHRPPMDWAAAERRHVPGAVEYEIWDGLQRLIAARRSTRATHGYGAGQPLWTGNDHVYGLLRSFAGERLLVLANFSSDEQRVRGAILDEHRMELTAAATVPDGRPARSDGDDVVLAPYQFLWIRG